MAWEKTSKRKQELPRNWHKIRQQALERDQHKCVWCGAKATHIDHITRGNNHNLDNLRSLCEHCHMKRTGKDGGHTPRTRKRKPTIRPAEQHPAFNSKKSERKWQQQQAQPYNPKYPS